MGWILAGPQSCSLYFSSYSDRILTVFRTNVWAYPSIQGDATSVAIDSEGTPVIVSQQITPAIDPQSLPLEEAAHALGCGRTTVFKLIREKRLRVVKFGTRTVIPRGEIERILNAAAPDVA